MEITDSVLNQVNENPLYNSIGIRVEEVGRGTARSRLEPKANLCWPFRDQPHGGVLFILMDTTMAWAVFSLADRGYDSPTVSVNIQYILPGKGKFFSCFAWTTHQTGHLGFTGAEIKDAEGQVIATGQGIFRLMRADDMKVWEYL